jgi:outer membrane protein TolC
MLSEHRAPMLRPVRSDRCEQRCWMVCATALACLAAATLGATPPARAGNSLDTLNRIYKEVQLFSDTITAYYGDMMRDFALLELQRDNVKVLEAMLRQARVRFTAGEATRTDLAQAESSLAAGRVSMRVTETQFAASRSRYVQAIEDVGRDVQTSPALPPVLPPVDPR